MQQVDIKRILAEHSACVSSVCPSATSTMQYTALYGTALEYQHRSVSRPRASCHEQHAQILLTAGYDMSMCPDRVNASVVCR